MSVGQLFAQPLSLARVDPGLAARDLRLFSSLLSRDGRYKFLSYANDL